jgi:hypothetical protein
MKTQKEILKAVAKVKLSKLAVPVTMNSGC